MDLKILRRNWQVQHEDLEDVRMNVVNKGLNLTNVENYDSVINVIHLIGWINSIRLGRKVFLGLIFYIGNVKQNRQRNSEKIYFNSKDYGYNIVVFAKN